MKEIGGNRGKRKPTYKKCPSPFFRFSYSRAKQSPRFHLAWHLSLPVPCLPRSQHTPTELRLFVVGFEQGRAAMDACDAGAVGCKGSRGSETTQCLDLNSGKDAQKPMPVEPTTRRGKHQNREWRKNAELCRMSCCAVAWRAGRERRTAGGAEVTALGLIMRCGEWILGSGSRDSRWYQCAPPRSPGRFLAPSGTSLVDSAAVHRSMAAPIPPHHHISMGANLFSDRESGGELAGSCIFCRAFLGFLSKAGTGSFFNTVSRCMSSFVTARRPPPEPPQAVQCRVVHCLAGEVLARIGRGLDKFPPS